MFKFLKGIFKEESEVEDVKVENLYNWFDEKSSFIVKDASSILKTFNLKIKEEIDNAKQNLDILSKAELKNKNVPERIIQMMQGNRQAYIKRINQFLDDIKEPINYEEYKKNFSTISNELDLLGKATQKNYYVLQEFFINESSRISYNIKKIENAVGEFDKRFVEKGINSVVSIKKKVKELEIQLTSKKQLLENIKEKEDEVGALKEGELEKIQKIEDFKKSEIFLSFEGLKREMEELVKQIDEHKQKLTYIFSIIEHGLKKFQRMSADENLIKEYLNDPVMGVNADPGYKIVTILEGMRKYIEEGKIELKDKKKDKTMEYSRKITKSFLKDFLIDIKKLEREKEEKKREILSNKVIEDYAELKELLKRKKNELDDGQKELDDLKKKLGVFEIEQLKESLQKKVKNSININLIIII